MTNLGGTGVSENTDFDDEITELLARQDRLNPATLAIAIADASLQVDDILHVDGRSTGSGGGAFWKVVLKSTVTISAGAPANGNIVASTGNTTLALVLHDNGFDDITQIGAIAGSTDSSAAMQATYDLADFHGEITVNKGIFKLNSIGSDTVSLSTRATFEPFNAGNVDVLFLGRENQNFRYREINSLKIDGKGAANGLSMKDITGEPAKNTSAGRWILNNLKIENCIKGINKPFGNINNVYNQVSANGCDFVYWARGRTVAHADFNATMHTGNDTFNQGRWISSALAAHYIDDLSGNTGQLTWNQGIWEGNLGFGIFVKNYGGTQAPITVHEGWFENNGTEVTVTIDGNVFTPRDMYFANAQGTRIISTKFDSLELVNASATLVNTWMNSNKLFVFDNDSYLRVESAFMDDFKGPGEVIIENLIDVNRVSGGTATVFSGLQRQTTENSAFGGISTWIEKSAAPVTYTGTNDIGTTTKTDGLTFSTCQELVLPDAHTAQHPTLLQITGGQYYVTTIELKIPTTADFTVSIQGIDTNVLFQGAEVSVRNNEWTTVCSVSKADATMSNGQLRFRNDSGGSVTIRTGAMQIRRFTNKQSALNYFNSRAFALV